MKVKDMLRYLVVNKEKYSGTLTRHAAPTSTVQIDEKRRLVDDATVRQRSQKEQSAIQN